MRTISAATISDAVAGLCGEAACRLPAGAVRALAAARRRETGPRARRTLGLLLENAAIARRDGVPVCQDTGVAFVWARLGQGVRITGGALGAAIDRGVRRGYRGGRLRASVLSDPLRGGNTGDNTPAFVHVELVTGDRLTLTLLPKGAGAENMSALRMFPPSAGAREIAAFVTETVVRSWANACPPLVVGVGIGSTFDGAPLLAKQALLRDLGRRHRDPFYARLERLLLAAVNATGIGPAGLGGRTTALAVHVEAAPRHIASLAVAVNLQCHAARQATVTL
ncbi:MAG: fumarate hydratase [Candidatus Edwardsbacteria bacterium]|nr:fumarate hydratase [Candidatus Edwardsbacteria bacterium]